MSDKESIPAASVAQAPAPGPPPAALAIDMVLGGWRAQALHAFCKSGLADIMNANDYMDAKALAEQKDLNANAVRRLLRFLSSVGVCVEEETGGRFKLGPVGEVCTKSHPESVAGRVLLECGSAHQLLWQNCPEYLKTGKNVTKTAFGVDNYWDMCQADPAHLKIFQEAMTSYSNDEATMMKIAPLSPTLNLSSFNVICDLGGAEGALARAMNDRFPDKTYIMADLEEAVARIDTSNLPSNITALACNFFVQETIPVADAYFLKHIIHDYNDTKSIEILSNIKVTNPKATIYVIEFGPMPGPNVPHLSKVFDIHMALTLDGNERTQEEYHALFKEAGYGLTKTHLLAGGQHPLYIQEIESS
mmetsp:Transcript_2885/g.3371  ORF Transcript_2885/g.3371 Transcript_2885/m.3371 type:complete len:361 (+) Transcript_2885:60-1142(+)